MNSGSFRALALAALAVCALAAPVYAQNEGAPISKAVIVNSLSKDITLDSSGVAVQPSMDLWVQFAFNSAQLTPLGRQQLDQLGMALNDKALVTWGFQLEGHTDAVGAADYNMRLSLERANAVKHYLMTQHGVNPLRLAPMGLGFTRLADSAHPEAAINRRVEVRRVDMAVMNTGAQALPPLAPPAPAAQLLPPAAGGRLTPTPVRQSAPAAGGRLTPTP